MTWFIIGGVSWCAGMFFTWSLVAINKGLPTPKPPQPNPEHSPTRINVVSLAPHNRYLHSINNRPRRHDIWE